jgi:hypothetical protein
MSQNYYINEEMHRTIVTCCRNTNIFEIQCISGMIIGDAGERRRLLRNARSDLLPMIGAVIIIS